MNPKYIALAFCVEYVLLAAFYFCDGDYRRGIYWLAATALNLTVTL